MTLQFSLQLPPPPDFSFQDKHCVPALLACLERGKSPLLHAPCGAGKTVIAAKTVARVRSLPRPWRVLVLAHRQELVHQAHRALRRVGMHTGGVQGSVLCPVTIDTVQTVHARLGRPGMRAALEEVDLLVMDEAHHQTARSWSAVISACSKAKVLALSATPWSMGGQPLGLTHVDEVVSAPSVRELIGLGCLTPAVVYQPRHTIDTRGIPSSAGDYSLRQLALAAMRDDITMSAIQEYTVRIPGQQAIAFTTTVEHAQSAAAAFTAAGWKAEAVDGSMSQWQRQQIFARLKRREIYLVMSCELISEGVDIPAVSAAIMLRPTKSARVHIQQAGRAIRAAPGKRTATILDFARNTVEHGLIEDERQWSLAGGLTPIASRPRVCTSCRRVAHHEDRCIQCGRTMPAAAPPVQPRAVSGVSPERIRVMDYKRFTAFCGTLSRDELYEAARQRGYQPGWVFQFLQRREQGQWRARR